MLLAHPAAPPSNSRLLAAAVASIAIHLLLLSWVPVRPRPVEVAPIEIDLQQTIPTTQIVSPSATESDTVPPNATRLSDKNSTAMIETLHRGEEGKSLELKGSAAQTPRISQPYREPTKATGASATSQAKAEPRSLPAHPKLKLDEASLPTGLPIKDSAARDTAPQKSSLQSSDAERLQKLLEAKPFQQSSNTGLFSARSGSSDYLPDVRDGEVTLLNAKADRFAVFVRRVALQVFGNIRRDHWQLIGRNDVVQARGFVTFEAVLKPTGELVSVDAREASGSAVFDRVVAKAVREGAWDKNPPLAAKATDGNIHFIFKARAWTTMVGGERPTERRWILLSTGLL